MAKPAKLPLYNTMTKPLKLHRHRIYYLIPAVTALILIISQCFPYPTIPHTTDDRCANRYIYIQPLPPQFNSDLLRDCRNLSHWTNMCRYTSNSGLGPILNTTTSSWYNTHQFSLEPIFHARMSHYDCLTSDPAAAAAIFVPYYAGLDLSRLLFTATTTSMRDNRPMELVRWLTSRPEWARMAGRDHFFVAGRITWDFRRQTDSDSDSDWGNKLLLMPEIRNMTGLVIESSPWHSNDVAIPYPTYFHPTTEGEVLTWQETVRSASRPWLFSFAGAPRANMTGSIRDQIINQCRDSVRCHLLNCGASNGPSSCHSPEHVMKMFESSTFCLQPQGDSYTRRSTFDSMVAGCIPVFFHPGSAYVQYTWHLPDDYKKYSVFISEDEIREGRVRIEEVLGAFKEDEVRRMREEVVGMIPRLIYVDPRTAGIEGMKDAFDVAVERVIERMRGIREGVESLGFEEAKSWKHGMREFHEWDHFFTH